MYRIIFPLIIIVIFFILYNIFSILFNVEKKDAIKSFEKAKIKKKVFKNPKYMFEKYIKLSKYSRDEFEAKLFSLNIEITPEQWISRNIFDFMLFLPIILFFLVIKNIVMSVIMLVLGLILFFDSMDKINRMLNTRRINIEQEAPSLIRFFMVSLKNTSDIKMIFEHYVEIASYLKRDVELTIIDMNSMRNQKDNLIRSLELLDDRLNTPIMNDFITGLINVTMGKNQESYFMLLERELKDLSMLNLERKSKKIEKTVRNYSLILIAYFVIFSVTEFIVFIISAFTF